jgi:hypothetical protein
MSFATEVRSYADSAVEVMVEQSRRALEAAQIGLEKLQHNVLSARAVGSLTPSIDAVRGTVEPLVATALTYGVKLAGKASDSVTELKKDARVAHVVRSGEALATAVISRTVAAKPAAKPAAQPTAQPATGSSTGSSTGAAAKPAAKASTKPAAKAAKSAPVKATATTKPATKATKATATKATTKPAAATKRTPGAAKKAPAS